MLGRSLDVEGLLHCLWLRLNLLWKRLCWLRVITKVLGFPQADLLSAARRDRMRVRINFLIFLRALISD